jgi:cysteine-S-conjugate beta-lyase
MTDDRTRLIASATRRGHGRRAVNPPIERASTMLSDRVADMRDASLGPLYGIEGLSAVSALKADLAALEGATTVSLVPSGLACMTLAIQALVRPGDVVLCSDAAYGPTRRFLTRQMKAWGVESRFHPADADAEAIMAMIDDRTRLVVLEAPASLTMEMVDVAAIAAACRARGVVTVMDNTWAAGLAFRPLAHGVDVSAQALTKYVSGHSDVLMGSIATADARLGRRIADCHEDFGWHVSPDDAWLTLRGLRTLPLRYEAQARAALEVATWLRNRPEVARILYPALPGDAGHALWRRDFTGAASLFGVVMKGGSTATAHALLDNLALFGLGYSWGGFESLITHETPQMAYRQFPPVLEGELLRLHIGLEAPADLIADLEQGLAAWRALQDSNLQPSA